MAQINDTVSLKNLYQRFNENNEAIQSDETDVEQFNLNAIEADPADTILCILYNNSFVGAAYFDLTTSQLYVLCDMADSGPQYYAIRLLIRLINPKYIIAMGSTCEEYIKCIIDSFTVAPDSKSLSDQLRDIPNNLLLLSHQEYSYDACKHRLFDVDLALNRNRNFDKSAKETYLNSIIDFDNKLSVHALAALIKFTEKNWLRIHFNDKEPLSFMNIKQTSLENYTFMDHVSFNGLQIFENKMHDSAFKRKEKNIREGFSLYKMFSQYCKCKPGCDAARNLMMNPISKLETLNMRLNFIEYATDPKNKNYIDDLQQCIKYISNIDTHLLRIQHSRAKGRNWKAIHITIYNTLYIQESAIAYSNKNLLLKLLTECITEPLYGLDHCIINAIDFDQKNLSHKPLIRDGLDEDLDAKRTQRQEIGKNVTAAAECMIDMIAANIDVKSITYIPDVGHMIVTRKKIEDETLDFQLFFEMKGYYHYKNPLCEELDNRLGDIQQEILAHENRILQNLTNFAIEKCVYLHKPLEYLALIDCLISVAKVSVERGFVRPFLNSESTYDIVQGLHPLLDYNNSNYVRNDWQSGGRSSKMKILTGPNGSGKTVYIKQIGIIVYLAHVGFYVPAQSANIGITKSIYSRLYAMESATLTLSSFQIDLTQMGHILQKATGNSLVLIDEFGKGSTGTEGLHLLAGSLRQFLGDIEHCPHVLISTHYESLSRLLPQTPVLSFHQMRFEVDENGIPVYLYKLDKGESGSFAIEVARSIGMNNTDILDDAERFLNCLRSGEPIRESQFNSHNKYKNLNINMDFLKDIVIPDLDVQ